MHTESPTATTVRCTCPLCDHQLMATDDPPTLLLATLKETVGSSPSGAVREGVLLLHATADRTTGAVRRFISCSLSQSGYQGTRTRRVSSAVIPCAAA